MSRALNGLSSLKALPADKLYELAIALFKVGQGACISSYGAKELFWDGIKRRVELSHTKKSKTLQSLDNSLKWFQERMRFVQKRAAEYYLVHGVLFIGSGISATLTGLHELQFINLGKIYSGLNIAASSIFVVANIAAFGYNLATIINAVLLTPKATPQELPVIQGLKKSSMLGLLSSTQYIAAASISLFGGPVVVIAVLGCVAASLGGLKILYDFFYLENLLKKF